MSVEPTALKEKKPRTEAQKAATEKARAASIAARKLRAESAAKGIPDNQKPIAATQQVDTPQQAAAPQQAAYAIESDVKAANKFIRSILGPNTKISKANRHKLLEQIYGMSSTPSGSQIVVNSYLTSIGVKPSFASKISSLSNNQPEIIAELFQATEPTKHSA